VGSSFDPTDIERYPIFEEFMTPLAARKWVVLWLAAEPMIDRLATDTVPNSQAWSRAAENGSKQTTYVEKQPCRRKEWVLNSPSPLVLAKVDIYPIKEGLTIPATPSQKGFVSGLLYSIFLTYSHQQQGLTSTFHGLSIYYFPKLHPVSLSQDVDFTRNRLERSFSEL